MKLGSVVALAALCGCDGKLEIFAASHGEQGERKSYSKVVQYGSGSSESKTVSVIAGGGDVAVESGGAAGAVKVAASGAQRRLELNQMDAWESAVPLRIEQRCAPAGAKPGLVADGKLLEILDEEALKRGVLKLWPGYWELSGFSAPVVLESQPLSSFKSGGVSDAALECLSKGDAKLELGGTGQVVVRNAASRRIEVRHSGTAELDVESGSVGVLDLKASGSGSVRVGAKVERMVVVTGGVCDVSASDVGVLDVRAKGAGSVVVSHARKVERAVSSGVAEVRVNGRRLGSGDEDDGEE